MTLTQLYERAYRENIEIDEVKMQALRAVSFPEMWIAIDPSKYNTQTEFKCDLAHEIGHCETGAFYNIFSHYDIKSKCERRANKRAVQILMPFPEVVFAIRCGYTEANNLAEYFDVTVDFAKMALGLYADRLHGIDAFERNARDREVKQELPKLMRASQLEKPMRHVQTSPPSYMYDLKDDILLRLPFYD